MNKLITVFAAAMIIFGCSKKETTYKQYDLNGIRITSNNGIPADTSLTIPLTKVGSIDLNVSVDQECNFNYAGDFAMDEKENIYILDQRNCRIHKYDKKGKFITAFGRNGSGPGEFQRPGYIVFGKDTLYVIDSADFSISKFDPEGVFIIKKQCSDINEFPTEPFRFGDGFISVGKGKMKTSENGNPVSICEVAMYNSQFELDKNIYLREYEIDRNSEYDPSSMGVKAAASGEFLFIYENSKDKYKIDVFDISGNKTREIRKNYLKLKQSEEYLQQQQERNLKMNTKYKTLFRNSIYALNTDKYGRLWVGATVKENEEGSYYDIFKDDVFQKRIRIELPEKGWIKYYGSKLIHYDNVNNLITIYDY